MIINIEEDFYDPEDDMDFSDFESYEDEYSEAFGSEMLSFLNDIIKQSDAINEDFTSDKNEKVHFNKHCIGKSTSKRSGSGRIYYDFTDRSQYVQYEDKITSAIRATDMMVDSLDDYSNIIKYMRKLFEGDQTVIFTKSCGLKDSKGHISLSFHAYSSDVTTNYNKGNTIDVCIKGKGNNTVSLYAIDAHSAQNRLNNIIKNNTPPDCARSFYFNND